MAGPRSSRGQTTLPRRRWRTLQRAEHAFEIAGNDGQIGARRLIGIEDVNAYIRSYNRGSASKETALTHSPRRGSSSATATTPSSTRSACWTLPIGSGLTTWEDAAKVWIASATKHLYRHIVFTSKPVPDDHLNLFRGFGVQSKKGDCKLIKQHIFEVICSGNTTNYEVMLNLMAYQVQNIGDPSRIIIVLISIGQQVGKGVFLEHILLRLFGGAGYMASDITSITGQFNSTALRGHAYIFLDEALFKGDKKSANVVKTLVTTKQTPLNEKHLQVIMAPVAVNVWIASNYDVPVHIEEHDARYWPLRVSEHRSVIKHRSPENFAYWDALLHETRNGGVEAFLWEMLDRDVSNFRPQRDVPLSNDLHTAMIQGNSNLGDPRLWVLEGIESGMLLYVDRDGDFLERCRCVVPPYRQFSLFSHYHHCH